MLKCPLHALYIVGGFAYVHTLILRVFDAQSESTSVIPTFPAPTLFWKVACTNRNAHVFVVEECAVQLEKVNQMLAQVDLNVLAKSLVLSLQV